jgi:hypothetical protein
MQLYEDVDDWKLMDTEDLIRILMTLDHVMSENDDHENIVEGLFKKIHTELLARSHLLRSD